ncbi:MAG: DNA primase family protein [Sulfitobacter sp.]
MIAIEKLLEAFSAPSRNSSNLNHRPHKAGNSRHDLGAAIEKMRANDYWHDNMIRSVAALVHQGCDDQAILSMSKSWRVEGFTEEETLSDVQIAIDTARNKGFNRKEAEAYDDIPLAKHLASKVAESSCYTNELGWLQFDGQRWIQDSKGARAKETIKRCLSELAGQLTSTGSMENFKLAKQLLTATKVKKVFELISSDACVLRRADEFDQALGMINLPNGLYNLENGDLAPHSPSDNLTKITGAPFDPSATCPHFDAFLAQTLDAEEQAFVMRLFGYALFGNPKEHVFAIFHGAGRNGKSTLLEAISFVLGDYASTAEPSTFIKQKGAGIRNDLARLKGARVVCTSELSSGEILDTALVKRVTGGEKLAARALFKEHFEFKPEFVMFMATNALPVIDGGDRALERRLILVPFSKTVAVDQIDPDLPVRLQGEASGILNRLLAGYADYKSNRLDAPLSVKKEIAKYIAHSDLIQNFLEEYCSLSEDGKCSAIDLYRAHVRWSQANGVKQLSQPVFKQEITKRVGVEQKRNSKGKFWPGIELRRKTSLLPQL